MINMRVLRNIDIDIILLFLFSISGVVKILSYDKGIMVLFLLLLFVPGFYLSKIVFLSELNLIDLIASSVILSVILEAIIYVFMITLEKYSYNNLIITNIIVLTVLYYFNKREVASIKSPSLIDILFSTWIMGITLLFVSWYLPDSFWDGWDPWINHHVSQRISDALISPSVLQEMYQEKLNVQISGFYYLLSYLHKISGIDLYYINRYLSLFINFGICFFMYSFLKDKLGRLGGLTFSLAFYLNDFSNQRFSMVLRENFAVLIFIYLIWFLERENDTPRRGILLVLIFSIIIMCHPLVTLLCFVYLLVNMFFSDDFIHGIYNLCFFMIALFIAYPISINYYRIVTFYINDSYINLALIFASAVGFVAALLYRDKLLAGRNYRKYFFVGLWFLTSYSLLFSQYEQSVWTHFKQEMISYFTLTASLLLFYRYRWEDSSHIDDFLLTVLILIQAPLFGVNLPVFRLSIYIGILGSYYCMVFFHRVYKHDLKGFLKADVYINLRELANWEYSYTKKIKSSILIVLFVLITLSPCIYHDFSEVYRHSARMNYLPEELREAEIFLGNLTEKDLVVGDHRDLAAVWFYDVAVSQIANKNIYQMLLEDGYNKDLVSLLGAEYPWADRLIVFNFKFKRVVRDINYSFIDFNNVTDFKSMFLEVYYLDL